MSMQRRAIKQKFSRQRRSLVRLFEEARRLIEPYLSDKPVIKGSVYELRRKCGKPGCRCTRGELHRSMVVTDSEKGKKSLRMIPRGFLVDVRIKVQRYRRLRRARVRLVEVQAKMLRVMDEMEAMRREEIPRAGKKDKMQ
jgi:hypothetical protein